MFSFVSLIINYFSSSDVNSKKTKTSMEPYIITTDTKHTLHMISFLSSPFLLENMIELNFDSMLRYILQTCHSSLPRSKKQCSLDFYRSSFTLNHALQANCSQFLLDLQQLVPSENYLTIISFCSQTIMTIIIDQLFSSLPENLYIGECEDHHCQRHSGSNRLSFSILASPKQQQITIRKQLRIFSVTPKQDAKTLYQLLFTIQIDCVARTIFCTIRKIIS